LNNHFRLFSISPTTYAEEISPPSKNYWFKIVHIFLFIYLEFQVDLPGVENYGFEGESIFMRCKHGAVASDSDEASKVGRWKRKEHSIYELNHSHVLDGF
jgi:hypothetical protein